MLKQRVQSLYADARAVMARLQPLIPTLVRITLGVEFIQTGWGKLHHLDRVIGFFGSLGIPHPELQAPFVAGLEFVGGLLVLLGFATRFISIPLAVSMLVALATAKIDDIKAIPDAFAMIEYLYAVMFAYLVIEGPGPWSLDALVARALGLVKTAPAEPTPLAKKTGNALLAAVCAGVVLFVGGWFVADHNPCDRVPKGEPFAEVVQKSHGQDEDAADSARKTCRQVLRWQAQGKDAAAELKKQAAESDE